MAVGIGAAGVVGIALEATAGTYTAPTKFFPIRSESLAWTQDTVWRRVIRGTVDPIGAVPGDGFVEGDIEMELLEDVLPYFMRCSRTTVVKTGVAAPYTYEFTGAHGAVPPKTMSVTVVRNGVAFGYTGVVVGSMSFGVDTGMATATFTLLGRAEASVAVPTPAYSATDKPFGSGQWVVEVPTATQIFDADGWSLEIEDNAEAQNRLKNSLGAQFIAYGEREVTQSLDRDFEDRTEYDAFKALTARSLTTRLSKDANASIAFLVPSAIIDSYDLGLSGVGDLVRASVSYIGTHDAGVSASYRATIVTAENMTI